MSENTSDSALGIVMTISKNAYLVKVLGSSAPILRTRPRKIYLNVSQEHSSLQIQIHHIYIMN
jgi:hypothetical protein